MRVTLSRIRARILNRIGWPAQNRQFVQTVSDVCFGREGWFSYGHFFMADEAGWIDEVDWQTEGCLKNDSAISQRVRRALLQYEKAEILTSYRLFEWKRGGGKSKAITQYGRNFLNEAAVSIQHQLLQIGEPIPALAKIDELIPGAIRLLRRRESRKLRALSSRRRRAKRSSTPPTPPQRDTQPTFEAKNSITHSALHLVRNLGVRIVPTFATDDGRCTCKAGQTCDRPGKHARIKGWQQRATRNEEVVRDWFDNKFVPANIAVITGEKLPDGGFLTVLDVDRRSFGFGTLALVRDEIELPDTLTVKTGDGVHYYFSSQIKIPNSKVGPGVDIQGAGGYVIGAGSTHANGNAYSIEMDTAVAPLPQALMELLVAGRLHRLEAIPEGERHSRLRACSYAMALRGECADAILSALRKMLSRCEIGGSRGVDDAEIEALAYSAVAKVQRAAGMVSQIVA